MLGDLTYQEAKTIVRMVQIRLREVEKEIEHRSRFPVSAAFERYVVEQTELRSIERKIQRHLNLG